MNNELSSYPSTTYIMLVKNYNNKATLSPTSYTLIIR